MPVTIKQHLLKVKDGSTYVGIDALAETSTAEHVTAINDAGATQIAAVQAKGTETIASIPGDYTELSNDVENLKSAIDETDENIGLKNLVGDITWATDKYINSSGDVVDNSIGIASDYIDVSEKNVLRFVARNYSTDYAYQIATYNSGKTFIERITLLQSAAVDGVTDYTLACDEDVKYIRIAALVNQYGKVLYISLHGRPYISDIANNYDNVVGIYTRKLLDFSPIRGNLTSDGDYTTDGTNRAATPKIPKETIYGLFPQSAYKSTFYAFDYNDQPLGFYFNGGFSKLGITWITGTSRPVILSTLDDYANIKDVKLYVGYPNDSAITIPIISKFLVYVRGTKYTPAHKWYAIGDSITYGTYSYENGSIARDPSIAYPKICSELLNYELVNYGVPDLGFTVNATDSQFTDDTIVKVLNNHSYADADLVTVALGTNDYGRNGTLGTIGDASSVNSIYGRIKLIVETLMTKCPLARIIFLTPIPRETVGSPNSQYDKTVQNSSGFTFNAVKNAIIESCEYYGIEYINLTDTCVLNYANHTTYQKDNMHPTISGHALMAKALAGKLLY